jgi:hypothetical protein
MKPTASQAPAGAPGAGSATSASMAADGIAEPPSLRLAEQLVPSPRKQRSRALELVVGAVALLALLVGGTFFAVQYLNAGWHVSLKANWTSVGTGSAVALSASANKKVDGSAYSITIKDAVTGAKVAMCTTGTTCTALVTLTEARSESFIALVGNQAQSASVSVAWRNWNLRLTAGKQQVSPGTAVTLSAQANDAIDFSRYNLAIVDAISGHAVKVCDNSASCVMQVSRKAEQQERFIAQVVADGVYAAA